MTRIHRKKSIFAKILLIALVILIIKVYQSTKRITWYVKQYNINGE